jgi:hypothetical protein
VTWHVVSPSGVTRCATPHAVVGAMHQFHGDSLWTVVATDHPAGVPDWLASQPGVLTLDDPIIGTDQCAD